MNHCVGEIVSETIVPASTATPAPATSSHPVAEPPSRPSTQVRMAPPSAADDAHFVTRLRDIVNLVYLETEGDIFVDGYQRISTEELQQIIRAGELGVVYVAHFPSSSASGGPTASGVAHSDDGVDTTTSLKDEAAEAVAIGCMRIHVVPSSAKVQLGMLAVDPAYRGGGVGREMMDFAASYCRSELGLNVLQLEALMPIGVDHAFKKRLQSWYERMGYELVRLGVFADDYPNIAPLLRGPTEYRVFEKTLV